MAALYAAEIRAALLRMSPDERRKAIRAAIDQNDAIFVSAACTGSPILTGVGKAEQAVYLDAWQRAQHGPTIQRIERLRAGLSQFNNLSSLFAGWALALFSEQHPAVEAAQRSERLAKEAMNVA